MGNMNQTHKMRLVQSSGFEENSIAVQCSNVLLSRDKGINGDLRAETEHDHDLKRT